MTATGCGRWGGSCFADPALGVKALAQLLPDTGRLLAKAGIYTESGQKHNGLANVYGAGVGGDRDLPAGGQQTLPTHGHLVTPRAGTGGTRRPRQVLPSTGTWGQGAAPSVFRVRDPRALPAGPTGGPMRIGGGAGLTTVPQMPATAARESNL